MLGGVLGGLGIGWLVDRFAHTGPWGVLGGLLIGAGVSVYATVQTASAISARSAERGAEKTLGPAPAVPDDDEDE
ncbi:MAG: AtpZ/AtpI family protein [Caulobacteraceae bacterium]